MAVGSEHEGRRWGGHRVLLVDGLPSLQALDVALVDCFGHPVKVNEQTEKNFICRGTVLVYSSQIVKNGDTGNILPVERQHARRLRAEIRGTFWRRNVPM